MKILVTGGAGFIGSHVVDSYLKLGHSVSVIDNLSTGKKENLSRQARFYLGDLKDRKFVLETIKKIRPDMINHHAALASLRLAVKRPEELIDANLNGTLNLLLATGKHPIKKFLFASSCSVFGSPAKLPADESCPFNPLSTYAFTKLMNEEMIRFYSAWHKFDFTIFRYPNVYGPRQNPKDEAGVIPIFANLIKNKTRPTIFGDGSKTRDYVFVSDIAKANALALKKGKNLSFNLGSGRETSDQEIFDKINNLLKSALKPIYAPFRPWEAKRIYLDAKKAEETLGWSPKVAFEEGIEKTLASLPNKII